MSVDTFLNAPCDVWEANPETKPTDDLTTWRHWLMDVLFVFARDGEQFRPARPNCKAGWKDQLDAALVGHGVDFAEVVSQVFLTDRNGVYPVQKPSERTVSAFEAFDAWLQVNSPSHYASCKKAISTVIDGVGHLTDGTLKTLRAHLKSLENTGAEPTSWPSRVEAYLNGVITLRRDDQRMW